DARQVWPEPSAAQSAVALDGVAGNACRSGVDQRALAEKDRPPQRDIVRRERTVTDLHAGELRLRQLRFRIQQPEQRLGTLLRYAADIGHHDAVSFLLKLEGVRVALIKHGLRFLQELNEPFAFFALGNVLQIRPGQATATHGMATDAVLLEEVGGLLCG